MSTKTVKKAFNLKKKKNILPIDVGLDKVVSVAHYITFQLCRKVEKRV